MSKMSRGTRLGLAYRSPSGTLSLTPNEQAVALNHGFGCIDRQLVTMAAWDIAAAFMWAFAAKVLPLPPTSLPQLTQAALEATSPRISIKNDGNKLVVEQLILEALAATTITTTPWCHRPTALDGAAVTRGSDVAGAKTAAFKPITVHDCSTVDSVSAFAYFEVLRKMESEGTLLQVGDRGPPFMTGPSYPSLIRQTRVYRRRLAWPIEKAVVR